MNEIICVRMHIFFTHVQEKQKGKQKQEQNIRNKRKAASKQMTQTETGYTIKSSNIKQNKNGKLRNLRI